MRHARMLLVVAVILVPVLGLSLHRPSPSANASPPVAKQLWHCGMHPQVIADHPGDCPICHMALTPIGSTATGDDEHPDGTVSIEPEMVQNMGVRTATVTHGPLHKTVRAVGMLKLAEPAARDISLKVSGWIDELYADQMAMHVHAGDPLFAVYSPELQIGAEELIAATQAARSATTEAARAGTRQMADSARRKLRLWDVAEAEIDAIARTDRPPRDIVFRSPITGHIEEKSIVAGSAIQPGARLLRIADHSKLWLDVQVYENEAGLIQPGEQVIATVEGVGSAVKGVIDFVYPHVDPMTRTITGRLHIDNPDLTLKPGMYASAQIVTDPLPDAVLCPREAVIDTGTRQIAFIADGSGHFTPRNVRMGLSGDDNNVQILEGLAPGEMVVTSGQFLLDAESRTLEATQRFAGVKGAASESRTQPNATPPASRQGSVTRPAELAVMYCPMKKAQWLQSGHIVANPFFGREMFDCGTEQRSLRLPEGAKVSEVVDAYLRIQTGLSADKLDGDAIGSFRLAVQSLRPADPELSKSAEALAAAKNIKEAHEAFIATSAALIHMLSGGK